MMKEHLSLWQVVEDWKQKLKWDKQKYGDKKETVRQNKIQSTLEWR